MVKNPPVKQETWVRFLSQEDALENERETHASILAWKIPWTEEPGGLSPRGCERVRHSLATEQQQQGVHLTIPLFPRYLVFFFLCSSVTALSRYLLVYHFDFLVLYSIFV